MVGISVGEEVRATSKPNELKPMVCFKVGLSRLVMLRHVLHFYNKIPFFSAGGHLGDVLQVHCSSSGAAQFAKARFAGHI